MLQISKCPNMRVVLTYWEALRDVSELSYKSLLYFSSNGSYCINIDTLLMIDADKRNLISEHLSCFKTANKIISSFPHLFLRLQKTLLSNFL